MVIESNLHLMCIDSAQITFTLQNETELYNHIDNYGHVACVPCLLQLIQHFLTMLCWPRCVYATENT